MKRRTGTFYKKFKQYQLQTKGGEKMDELLTEYELSEWLTVSKSTLHKLRETGQIPFQMIGSSIRYSKRDIEQWLKYNSFNQLDKGEQK